MKDDYGYFKRTEGKDGDQVDCFINSDCKNFEDKPVFVIDQQNPATKKFDEHKVILGAETKSEAETVYKRNYDKKWDGIKNIAEFDLENFKDWLFDKNKTKKEVKMGESEKSGESQNNFLNTNNKTQMKHILDYEDENFGKTEFGEKVTGKYHDEFIAIEEEVRKGKDSIKKFINLINESRYNKIEKGIMILRFSKFTKTENHNDKLLDLILKLKLDKRFLINFAQHSRTLILRK